MTEDVDLNYRIAVLRREQIVLIERIIRQIVCIALVYWVFSSPASAEGLTNAIHAFLQQRVEVEKRDAAVVVGIVDEHGSSVISCGKPLSRPARLRGKETIAPSN